MVEFCAYSLLCYSLLKLWCVVLASWSLGCSLLKVMCALLFHQRDRNLLLCIVWRTWHRYHSNILTSCLGFCGIDDAFRGTSFFGVVNNTYLCGINVFLESDAWDIAMQPSWSGRRMWSTVCCYLHSMWLALLFSCINDLCYRSVARFICQSQTFENQNSSLQMCLQSRADE